MMAVIEIIMLDTLDLYCAVCRLYLNTTGRRKTNVISVIFILFFLGSKSILLIFKSNIIFV